MTDLFEQIRVHAMHDGEKMDLIQKGEHLDMLCNDASLQIRIRAKKVRQEVRKRVKVFAEKCSQGKLLELIDDVDFATRTHARAQLRKLKHEA